MRAALWLAECCWASPDLQPLAGVLCGLIAQPGCQVGVKLWRQVQQVGAAALIQQPAVRR